jgi:hypothetical protein
MVSLSINENIIIGIIETLLLFFSIYRYFQNKYHQHE